jgi:hypothetical protein
MNTLAHRTWKSFEERLITYCGYLRYWSVPHRSSSSLVILPLVYKHAIGSGIMFVSRGPNATNELCDPDHLCLPLWKVHTMRPGVASKTMGTCQGERSRISIHLHLLNFVALTLTLSPIIPLIPRLSDVSVLKIAGLSVSTPRTLGFSSDMARSAIDGAARKSSVPQS